MNLEDCDSPDRLPRHTVKQAYIWILLDAVQPLTRVPYFYHCGRRHQLNLAVQQLIVFVSSVSIVVVAAAAVPAVAALFPSSDQSATARPSSSAIVLLVVLIRHVRRVRRRR